MEDLNAASLDDVKEWFKTYYGPSNAVLVVAGDITPAVGQGEGRAVLRRHPARTARGAIPVVGRQRTGVAASGARGPRAPVANLQGVEHARVRQRR